MEKPKKAGLLRGLLGDREMDRTLVFTRTKHGADRVVKMLGREGIEAVAIHGNKTQAARTRALAGFKSSRTPVLVATDIASRGIDVDEITHVVNYDIPNEAETYVHRIGRTARAGSAGVAISFCDANERGDLKAIERLIGRRLDVVKGAAAASMAGATKEAASGNGATASPTAKPKSNSNSKPKPKAKAVESRGTRATPAAGTPKPKPKRKGAPAKSRSAGGRASESTSAERGSASSRRKSGGSSASDGAAPKTFEGRVRKPKPASAKASGSKPHGGRSGARKGRGKKSGRAAAARR